MGLQELEPLDVVLTEAQQRGIAPAEQLELIDFWRNEAMTGAETYFKPEQSREHQEWAGHVDSEVTKAKDPLIKSVTENIIGAHFGDDTGARNDFINEVNQHNENNIAFSNASNAALAASIDSAQSAANRPAATQPLQSALRDHKGNSIVEASISYNENGDAKYASINIPGEIEQGEGEETPGALFNPLLAVGHLMKNVGVLSQGTKPLQVGASKGGDVIQFPKGFNGLKYLTEQKDKQIAKIAEFAIAEERSLIDPDRQVANYSADLDRLKKERADLANISGVDALKKIEQEGVHAYLNDTIREKIKSGDKRYEGLQKSLRDDLLDGTWQNVKNTISQMWHGRRAGAASNILSLRKFAGEQGILPPLDTYTSQDPVSKHLRNVIEDVAAGNETRELIPTYTTLGIEHPTLAKNLDKATGAVTQGIVIAAEFGATGSALGYVSTYLQGAGDKVAELTSKANDLRAKGDIKSADWLDRYKYQAAMRFGAYELIPERLSMGHNPFRLLGKGSGAGLEFVGSLGGESVEEGITATAGALDDYVNGVINYEGLINKLQTEVPESMILGAVGTFIPAGARFAVSSMLSDSLKTGLTPPPVPPGYTGTDAGDLQLADVPQPAPEEVINAAITRAADRAEANATAAASVRNAIDGTPGDQGTIVVGEPRGRKPKTDNNIRTYLRHVARLAGAQFAELGDGNIAMPILRNAQEQEIEDEATIYRVLAEDDPAIHQQEEAFSRKLRREIEGMEEFRQMTPEEQKKFLDQTLFSLDPKFFTMKRMGVTVGDGAGRTVMMTTTQAIRAIETGELDPDISYFYKDESVGTDSNYSVLRSMTPEKRWVGRNIGVGTRTKQTPEGPKQVQSKANEQVIISGLKAGLKTSTIGGRDVHRNEISRALDDELIDPEITTEQATKPVVTWDEETGGRKTVSLTGRFLTPAAETKLIQNLDAKYGKNNWVLKKDGELKGIGTIFPWVKGGLTHNRTRFALPISVMEDHMYIAQERVQKPKAEYRVHVRANKDGTLNIVPLGIHGGKLNRKLTNQLPYVGNIENEPGVPDEEAQMGMGFGDFPLFAVPKTVRNKIVDLLKDLEGTEIVSRRDTVYGIDVVVDENDNYKIVELNQQDAEGISGGLAMYTSVTNGYLSMMRSGHSAEAMVIAAEYQRFIGNEKIAEKIFEEAVDQLHGKKTAIPNADALYHAGTFFAQPKPIAFERGDRVKAMANYFHQFGDKGDVHNLLYNIGALNTDDYLKRLAARLFAAAVNSENPGLQAPIIHSPQDPRYSEGIVYADYDMENALHEVMHALSVWKIPPHILNPKPGTTKKQYKKLLTDYIAQETGDTKLKRVMLDYIRAVEGIAGSHKFDDSLLETRTRDTEGEYGLSSLHEFIASALTKEGFAKELRSIKSREERNLIRRLLNSVMEYVKGTLFGRGNTAKTLFDKTYVDIMALIAVDQGVGNQWEHDALVRNPFTTIDAIFNEDPLPGDDEGLFYAQNPFNGTLEVEGHNINTSHLTKAEKAELDSVLHSSPKLPSRDRKEITERLKRVAEQREFQLLKEAWPQAFDPNINFYLGGKDGKEKIPRFKEFTTLESAEAVLIDYLVDNPKETKGTSVLSPSANAKATQRLKLVRQATSYYSLVRKKIDEKTLKGYESLPADIQTQVVRVVDWILNGGNPKDLTNRQLTANNLALKNFIRSDGKNIRGFAAMAQQLYIGQENSKLADLKGNLLAQGVNNPWGHPIDDWRRNLSGTHKTKTGTSLADWTTEMLAIFNRPETRKIFAAMFAPFATGIHNYKKQLSDFRDEYNQRLRDLSSTGSKTILGKTFKTGTTTKLQDVRIGMAALLTQFDQANDPLGQITSFVEQVNESISRKESIKPILKGGDITKYGQLRKDAPIERAAWNSLVDPIVADIRAGTLTHTQIIQFIEEQLTPQEYNILELIREPGRKYYADLDAINQMARQDGLENWMNYFKRVQVQMNGDQMTRHWGADAIQSADSILQPREGLKEGNVFILDFRPAFQWQLNETAYELNTGVDRVMLFQLLKDPTFAQIMDENDKSTPRTQRIQAQIGGVHSNIKNPEIQFGIAAGTVVEALRLAIIKDLVTGRAFANQLIPFFNIYFHNPTVTSDVSHNLLFKPANRKAGNAFLEKHIPDLHNRLRGWDQMVEGFQTRDKHKDSGMTTNMLNKTIEKMFTWGGQAFHVANYAFKSPWVGQLGLTITNGLSEVFSAKNVFFTLYISKLIKAGTIQNADEFFANPEAYFNPITMTETQMEFDSYVLSPISSEFRSEMSQRNSASKILANLSTNALGRTGVQQSIKSVTSLRDLFLATVEVGRPSGRNAANMAFLKETGSEVIKQMMNLALYHGIRSLYQISLGGIATAAWFVSEALMSGDPEDEEYWRRRLRNLERVNRERQAAFAKEQMHVDASFFGVPFPGLVQNNIGREIVNQIYHRIYIDNRTATDFDTDLEIQRKQRAEKRAELANAVKFDPPVVSKERIHDMNEALEVIEYGIAVNEKLRDERVEYFTRATKNIVQAASSLTEVTSDKELYKARMWMPDYLEDILFADKEKVEIQKQEMDKVQNNSAWYALSAHFNMFAPTTKAIDQTLKEFATKELNNKKRKAADQLDRAIQMKVGMPQ